MKATFAHPILAAAYAGYLSAKLEIESAKFGFATALAMPPLPMKSCSVPQPKKIAGPVCGRSLGATALLIPMF